MLNGSRPRGLPLGGQAAVLRDPRTYFRPWTAGGGAGGNTNETPIAPIAAQGATGGRVSAYARAVANTPGLMCWWRFGKAIPNHTLTGNAPYFPNSAGAPTLRSITAGGTPKVVPGLIPGDTDGACDLNGGYLDSYDFRVLQSANEVMTAEMWVNLRSLKSDCGYVGEWQSDKGWMIYSASGSDLRVYSGEDYLDCSSVLTTGRHHIVAVWGGQEPPTPDYYTRLYVDGQLVGSGLVVLTGSGVNNDTTRFMIGNYANGGGTNNMDGIVDEVAIYNRMLQPEEVKQHYRAAFVRGEFTL